MRVLSTVVCVQHEWKTEPDQGRRKLGETRTSSCKIAEFSIVSIAELGPVLLV